jgi:FtsX-like permease family protein
MTAHWVVLAAVALTTLVAAVVGAALAAFAGQALPHAVRHELTTASGTSIAATAPVSGSGAAAQATATLRTAIGAALPGIPFAFWQASWSDPLGFAPGTLRSRPAAAPAGSTLLLTVAAMQDVRERVTLVAGQWPGAPATTAPQGAGQPIPAALPATAAALLHVSVGDVLRLEDRVSNAPVTFRVTGLVTRRQLPATAAYWQLDPVPASGSVTIGGFTSFGPLLVDPAAFGAALPVASATWAAQPNMTAFTDADLSSVAASVSALQNSVAGSAEPGGAQLSGVQLTTSLAGVLSGTAENLTVARSLLAISAVQLLVLAVAALVAIARLLAAQRAAETELLTARGADRWQLTRLTAIEVIPLCCVAAIAGAFAGIRLAQLLAGTIYPGTAGDGGVSAGAAGTWLDALGATVAAAVIASAVLLYPVLRPAPGGARVRRGRQAVLAGATRAGADLGLIVLAVLAGWQLRRYSAVSAGAASGTPSIDPVLALAPALALAGGTVVLLRLLPAAARGGDRLAARGRTLTGALAGWQFSRQPLRQGGAALLLVMAVATGTLALAQHQSWTQSASDQAAYKAGADVRADLSGPLGPGAVGAVTQAPGVRSAMAVSVTPAALPAEVLAIDASQAPRTVLLRGDQSPQPAGRLFATIAPAGPAGGTEVSGRPDSIRLTASLSTTGRAGIAASIGAVTVLVTITDSAGGAYQLPAGTLPADGRPHVLTVPLGGTKVSYPLRLTQVSFGYTLPATSGAAAPLTLTVIGARLAGWTAAAASPELDQVRAVGGQGAAGPAADPGTVTWRPSASGATLAFTPGYGRAAPGANAPQGTPPLPLTGQVTLTAGGMAPAAIPAIATAAFLDANNTAVGATVPATIDGVTVQVRIAAETATFPTVTGSALIVDLRTLQGDLASHGGFPLPVTEWWLATAGGTVPPGLSRALPPGSAVTSAAALAATVTADPLAAAPQQALLALAAAAALLAITGFWVSIAADVRQRRAETALLAALGVGRRSAAAELFLEKLMLSVPSAVLGLVLGIVVARLLVPAVTLTTSAQQPVPPPVTLFDLPQTLPLAAAVAILPALAAALVVVRRPDPAAELRAAEGA